MIASRSAIRQRLQQTSERSRSTIKGRNEQAKIRPSYMHNKGVSRECLQRALNAMQASGKSSKRQKLAKTSGENETQRLRIARAKRNEKQETCGKIGFLGKCTPTESDREKPSARCAKSRQLHFANATIRRRGQKRTNALDFEQLTSNSTAIQLELRQIEYTISRNY